MEGDCRGSAYLPGCRDKSGNAVIIVNLQEEKVDATDEIEDAALTLNDSLSYCLQR